MQNRLSALILILTQSTVGSQWSTNCVSMWRIHPAHLPSLFFHPNISITLLCYLIQSRFGQSSLVYSGWKIKISTRVVCCDLSIQTACSGAQDALLLLSSKTRTCDYFFLYVGSIYNRTHSDSDSDTHTHTQTHNLFGSLSSNHSVTACEQRMLYLIGFTVLCHYLLSFSVRMCSKSHYHSVLGCAFLSSCKDKHEKKISFVSFKHFFKSLNGAVHTYTHMHTESSYTLSSSHNKQHPADGGSVSHTDKHRRRIHLQL